MPNFLRPLVAYLRIYLPWLTFQRRFFLKAFIGLMLLALGYQYFVLSAVNFIAALFLASKAFLAIRLSVFLLSYAHQEQFQLTDKSLVQLAFFLIAHYLVFLALGVGMLLPSIEVLLVFLYISVIALPMESPLLNSILLRAPVLFLGTGFALWIASVFPIMGPVVQLAASAMSAAWIIVAALETLPLSRGILPTHWSSSAPRSYFQRVQSWLDKPGRHPHLSNIVGQLLIYGGMLGYVAYTIFPGFVVAAGTSEWLGAVLAAAIGSVTFYWKLPPSAPQMVADFEAEFLSKLTPQFSRVVALWIKEGMRPSPTQQERESFSALSEIVFSDRSYNSMRGQSSACREAITEFILKCQGSVVQKSILLYTLLEKRSFIVTDNLAPQFAEFVADPDKYFAAVGRTPTYASAAIMGYLHIGFSMQPQQPDEWFHKVLSELTNPLHQTWVNDAVYKKVAKLAASQTQLNAIYKRYVVAIGDINVVNPSPLHNVSANDAESIQSKEMDEKAEKSILEKRKIYLKKPTSAECQEALKQLKELLRGCLASQPFETAKIGPNFTEKFYGKNKLEWAIWFLNTFDMPFGSINRDGNQTQAQNENFGPAAVSSNFFDFNCGRRWQGWYQKNGYITQDITGAEIIWQLYKILRDDITKWVGYDSEKSVEEQETAYRLNAAYTLVSLLYVLVRNKNLVQANGLEVDDNGPAKQSCHHGKANGLAANGMIDAFSKRFADTAIVSTQEVDTMARVYLRDFFAQYEGEDKYQLAELWLQGKLDFKFQKSIIEFAFPSLLKNYLTVQESSRLTVQESSRMQKFGIFIVSVLCDPPVPEEALVYLIRNWMNADIFIETVQDKRTEYVQAASGKQYSYSRTYTTSNRKHSEEDERKILLANILILMKSALNPKNPLEDANRLLDLAYRQGRLGKPSHYPLLSVKEVAAAEQILVPKVELSAQLVAWTIEKLRQANIEFESLPAWKGNQNPANHPFHQTLLQTLERLYDGASIDRSSLAMCLLEAHGLMQERNFRMNLARYKIESHTSEALSQAIEALANPTADPVQANYMPGFATGRGAAEVRKVVSVTPTQHYRSSASL